MFETIKKSLSNFDRMPKKPDTGLNRKTTMVQHSNGFIKNSLKSASVTNSLGNGATKFTTTGSPFVDQFGNATNYKSPRTFQEISKDMSLLWSLDSELAIRFTLYLRTITRVTQLPDGSKTEIPQIGQGLKHEGIMRMIWLALNHPDSFWKNITLFISVGSFKDIIVMLSYDLKYNDWNNKVLDWDKFGKVLLAALENPNTSELVKKYLPQIKSNSDCKTVEAQADNVIAKWICSLLFGEKDDKYIGRSYKQYRLLKSSGTAHTWQQLISRGEMLKIDFSTIHGRALAQFVSGKFLKNQGLEEKYATWIASKPTAKYTGYVYELFAPLGNSLRGTRQSIGSLKPYQVETINKQFLQLVEVAKKVLDVESKSNGFIGVLDTSASMSNGIVGGTNHTAYSIGKSLTLFLSYILEGKFKDVFLEFSDKTIMNEWRGSTPVEKLINYNSRITASTNFQSVPSHFVEMLQSGVEESEFPTGMVCFSDGCFSRLGSNRTNFVELKRRLLAGGFSENYVDNFKVILLDIPNNYYHGQSQTSFESDAIEKNLFHISGLDITALAFITGVKGQKSLPKNSDELFLAAMNQQILNMIEV